MSVILYKCRVCEEEKPFVNMCKYRYKGEQRARKICNPCERETSCKKRAERYYLNNIDLCRQRGSEYGFKYRVIKNGKLPKDFKGFKIIKFDPSPYIIEDEEEK